MKRIIQTALAVVALSLVACRHEKPATKASPPPRLTLATDPVLQKLHPKYGLPTDAEVLVFQSVNPGEGLSKHFSFMRNGAKLNESVGVFYGLATDPQNITISGAQRTLFVSQQPEKDGSFSISYPLDSPSAIAMRGIAERTMAPRDRMDLPQTDPGGIALVIGPLWNDATTIVTRLNAIARPVACPGEGEYGVEGVLVEDKASDVSASVRLVKFRAIPKGRIPKDAVFSITIKHTNHLNDVDPGIGLENSLVTTRREHMRVTFRVTPCPQFPTKYREAVGDYVADSGTPAGAVIATAQPDK
jgi:hypothetical protein